MSEAHEQVVRWDRYVERLRAEGKEIVCVLRRDPPGWLYQRTRHDYVNGLAALEAGDLERACREFRSVVDSFRWSPFVREDSDRLRPCALLLLTQLGRRP